MSNPYFQFKQFTIHQDRCAMKVCTDACILGAWFAEKIPSYSVVLDIGSGTGLLMLMLAQKNKAKISGVEIDLASCKQSKENIAASRWRESLKIFPGDVRTHAFTEKFSFIICNPPFFENDLKSHTTEKNIAKHSEELSLEELLQVIDMNLDESGSFGILLPFHRLNYFEKLVQEKKFHVTETLLVQHSPNHGFFRCIVHFSRKAESLPATFHLSIHSEDGVYSEEFTELMKDYYLHL